MKIKTDDNLSSKNRFFDNRDDEFKQYCKKLGGFYYICCESEKKFLEELGISDVTAMRLMYLATYMDYNYREENVLVKHGKNYKLEYLTRKDLKELLNLTDRTFNNFLKETKEKNLLYCVDKKYYISPKYFTRGRLSYSRNNKVFIKVFIKPIREIYLDKSNMGQSLKGGLFRLIPFLNGNNILTIEDRPMVRKEISLTCSKESKSKKVSNFEKILYNNESIFKKTKDGYRISPQIALIGNKIIDLDLKIQKEFTSIGEQKIKDFLTEHDIKFEEEYAFKDLIGKHGGHLRYDFYLPDYKLLIEFQGQQHLKYIPYIHGSYGSFIKNIHYDMKKREYAAKHKINLLEIWYYNQDNIEYILTEHLREMEKLN